PWTFAEGIIFDTRSVLISTAGLFFGVIPTLIVMLITAAYRLYISGPAALTGVLVILASGGLGLGWRYLRRRQLEDIPARQLYLFGLLVHLVMLALMFSLPLERALEVVRTISLPVVLIYPLGNLALGLLLQNRLRRERLWHEHERQIEYLQDSRDFFQESYPSLQKFLEAALQRALNISRSPIGFLLLYDENHSRFEVTVFSSTTGALNTMQNPTQSLDPTPGGLLDEVLRQKKPVVVNDYRLPNPLRLDLPAGHPPLERFLGVPAVEDGRVTVLLGVTNSTEEYGEEDALRLSLFVDGVWKAVKRFQMQEQMRLQSTALAAAANVVVITDRYGTIEWVNPAFTRTTGYTLEEAIGQNPRILQSGRHDQTFYENLWNTILAGQVWRGELINRRKDGSLYIEQAVISPVRNDEGEITHFIAIKEDITARRKAEEAAHESEQRFALMAEAAPVMIWMTHANGMDGYVNRAWREFMGCNETDDLNRVWEERLHPHERDALIQTYQHCLQARIPFIAEYRLRRADGEYRWVSDHGEPRFSASGEFLGMIGVFYDITEQRQQGALLAAITAINHALTRAIRPQDMFNRIVREISRLLEVDAAMLEVIHPETGQIEIVSASGPWKNLEGQTETPLEHIRQQVVAQGKPYVENHQGNQAEKGVLAPACGCQAIASVPLEVDYQNLGILTIGSYQSISKEKVEMLEGIAEVVAGVIYRDELYRRIEQNAARLGSLRIIDGSIIEGQDLKTVLRIVLEQTTHQLKMDASSIFLFNPQNSMLEYAADYGFKTRGIERTLKLGQSNAGKAALQRLILAIPDLNAQREEIAGYLLEDEGFVFQAVAPLVAKGDLIGVMEMFARRPFQPGDEWLKDLQTFATQAAIAINSILNFEALQHSNCELQTAYEATIEGWSRAMDLRDHETENHTLRVTELTLRLARQMGVREEDLIHYRRGALLHDIGKLGVPDSILQKAGPLSHEEWALMRQHPIYAYQMLYPIEYLRPAIEIPYCHHEKWDGTGYPRGLKGEEIPLAARIFAVVDVFDALTSDRPYRKAWNIREALDYIKEQTGKHFDPQVVEAFLRLYGTGSLKI
ncbi:MAG: PAS domain S-box protein, partial [Bellilinea sp.]|nr:PAS domain S-box protein [Bellilinea sp.]